MSINLVVHGACGRMGQRLVALAFQDPALKIVAGIDASHHPLLGRDVGDLCGVGHLDIPITHDLPFDTPAEVLIDFSVPSGTMRALKLCLERHLPIVIATTGHEEAEKQEIAAASHHIPVLFAPNMSLVVNLLFKLTHITAEVLKGRGFDTEIIERHHRFKKDAPSGTALHFARIIQETMHLERQVHGREGLLGERPADEIGIHAVRAGDNVGEHTIIFATLGETLELVHKGTSRDSYALGALEAAKFLVGKPAGTYTMADVLGL